MTYKEWIRYKRNKNRAKKRRKKKEEAGAMTLGYCMTPFILASLYYIFVLGAVV